MSQPDLPFYYLACTYPNEKAARKAYVPLQHIIHDIGCELSAYRFFMLGERTWYVVVIGETPDPGLHSRLETILTTLTRGTPVVLEREVLILLLARRVNQLQEGTTWKENHYFK